MNLVRLILTLLFIPVFVLIVRGTGSRSRALRGIALMSGVGICGVIINFPTVLDKSARSLGIGAGLDLVVYILVLGTLVLSGYVVGKFRRMERRIAVLVQEMAVLTSSRDSKDANKST